MIELLRSRFEILAAGLFLIAWALIFVLRAIPLGGEWGYLSVHTAVFIALWVLTSAVSIIAGGWIAQNHFVVSPRSYLGIDAAVIALSLASAFGAILIIVEFAFVRGYGLTMPVTEIRILEVNRGFAGAPGSLLSGPGRLMMPAILPALLMVAYHGHRLSRAALVVFGVAALLFLFEQVRFEGGRWFLFGTYFALAAGLLGGVLKAKVEGGNTFSRRLVDALVFLVLYGVILFGYSGWVFANRYDGSGEGQVAAYERVSNDLINIRHSEPLAREQESPWKDGEDESVEQQYEVDDQESELNGQEQEPELDGREHRSEGSREYSDSVVGKLLLHPVTKFFWIYATHGVNELNNLVLGEEFSHSLGAFQFPQLARIIDRLFGTDLRVEYKSDFPNDGLYTTLIGASYVDFGFLGAVGFGALFGLGLGVFANLFGRQRGASFSSMAFPAMMTVALLSPIISVVNHFWPVMFWAVVAYGVLVLAKKKNIS